MYIRSRVINSRKCEQSLKGEGNVCAQMTKKKEMLMRNTLSRANVAYVRNYGNISKPIYKRTRAQFVNALLKERVCVFAGAWCTRHIVKCNSYQIFLFFFFCFLHIKKII